MYARSLVAKIRWILFFTKSGHKTEQALTEAALKREEFTYFKAKGRPPVACTPSALNRVVLFCRRIGLLDGNLRVTSGARRVSNVTKDEDDFLRSLGEFMKEHVVDATGKFVGHMRLRLAIKEIWKAKGATLPRPREIQAMVEKGTGRNFDEETFAKTLNVLSACGVLLKYRRSIYLVPDARETRTIARIDGESTNQL
jgi:hypothetical protein